MPGKPDFTTPTDMIAQSLGNIDMNLDSQTLANADISVNKAPVESLEFIDADATNLGISSGSTFTKTIRAPNGYIYEVIGAFVKSFAHDANGGATSGTHYLEFRSEANFIALTRGRSNYTDNLQYQFSNWDRATNNQKPSDSVAQKLALKGLRIDGTNGLLIEYKNNTDTTYNGDINIRLWVRKIKVS